MMSVKLPGINNPYHLFEYLPLAMKLSQKILSLENQVKLQYPQMCEGCSLFQCQAKAAHPQHVNITTNNMSYKGQNNILCEYAGLAVFEKKYKTYKEITTVCYTHIGYAHRNIYTRDFEAVLVFYSYPLYGTISITVSISFTNCKIITINTCVFETKCNILGRYCNTLRNIMSHESFESDGIGKPGYGSYGRGFFKVNTNERHCTVFQLFHNTDQYTRHPTPHEIYLGDMRLRLCRLPNFRHSSEIGTNIHYTITGYLSGRIA